MKTFHLFALSLFLFCDLSALGRFIQVESPSTRPGMFSVFNTVIGSLDLFETQGYNGFSVNFGKEGHYYEPALGENWWNYYLEPLQIGTKEKSKILTVKYQNAIERALYTERKLSKKRVHQLIERYFHFQPFVLDQVEAFVRDHFKGKRVIGLHYRGTDKVEEAPKVSYEEVVNEVRKVLSKDDLLFVATDEEKFLTFLQNTFPDQLIFLEAMRSKGERPIHKNHGEYSGFQLGLEALMDAFLLSRCDFLIRTSSNLSLFSTYLNPSLNELEVNKRYPPKKLKDLLP